MLRLSFNFTDYENRCFNKRMLFNKPHAETVKGALYMYYILFFSFSFIILLWYMICQGLKLYTVFLSSHIKVYLTIFSLNTYKVEVHSKFNQRFINCGRESYFELIVNLKQLWNKKKQMCTATFEIIPVTNRLELRQNAFQVIITSKKSHTDAHVREKCMYVCMILRSSWSKLPITSTIRF